VEAALVHEDDSIRALAIQFVCANQQVLSLLLRPRLGAAAAASLPHPPVEKIGENRLMGWLVGLCGSQVTRGVTPTEVRWFKDFLHRNMANFAVAFRQVPRCGLLTFPPAKAC
jgi:hypothetical protein